jgi:hypothetical protein
MNLRNKSFAVLVTIVFGFVSFGPREARGASCESLKSFSLENTTITLAESVPAGRFMLPTNTALAPNAIEQMKGFAKQLFRLFAVWPPR